MNRYMYHGAVMIFDRVVHSNWTAETMAPSVAKAKNNFKYQYKEKHNLIPGTRVDLPGVITIVD